LLIDVGAKGITGKDAERALGEAGITVNKNSIPFDTRPPKITSGIRIGTPAVTTRGMKGQEMEVIGRLIGDVLIRGRSSKAVLEKVRELCSSFPLYPARTT